MQSIAGTPECIEDAHAHRSALQHRQQAVAAAARSGGPGPVDLVWCSKRPVGSHENGEGFFHHVLGQDVTSTASAAAYFAELCGKQEQAGVLPSLFSTTQCEVHQCVYCCYDAFSQLDVQCCLSNPGGIYAHAKNGAGQKFSVSDDMWCQVAASAFLRFEVYNAQLCQLAPALSRRQPMQGMEAESSVLESITWLYQSGKAQKGSKRLTPMGHTGHPQPHENDVLLAAVMQHFSRRCAWDLAADYFACIAKTHAPAVVHLAVALGKLERHQEALQMLRKNAQLLPRSIDIILSLALVESAHLSNHAESTRLAQYALALDPQSHTALCTLATVAARSGQAQLTFCALAAWHTGHKWPSLSQAAFPAGVAAYAGVTTPREQSPDADVAATAALHAELDFTDQLGVHDDAAVMPTSFARAPHHQRRLAYRAVLTLCQHHTCDAIERAAMALFSPRHAASEGARSGASEVSSSALASSDSSGEMPQRSAVQSIADICSACPAPMDLWQATFGTQQGRQSTQGSAGSSLVEPRVASGAAVPADLTCLPAKLQSADARRWHFTDAEGPVAEANAKLPPDDPDLQPACAHSQTRGSHAAPCGEGSNDAAPPERRAHATAHSQHSTQQGRAGRHLRWDAAQATGSALHLNPDGLGGMPAPSPVHTFVNALAGHHHSKEGLTLRQLARLQVQAQEFASALRPEPPSRRQARMPAAQSAAESVFRAQDLEDWAPGHMQAQGNTTTAHAGSAAACSGGVDGYRALQHNAPSIAAQIGAADAVNRAANKLQSEMQQGSTGNLYKRMVVALLREDMTYAPVSDVPRSVSAPIEDVKYDLRLVLSAMPCVQQAGGKSPDHAEHDWMVFAAPAHAQPNAERFDESQGSQAWARAGFAADRLACTSCAEALLQLHARAGEPDLGGSLVRARIAATQGDVRHCLDVLTDAVLCLGSKQQQAQQQQQQDVCASVLAAVSRLISSAGMAAVQAVLEDSVGQVHPALSLVAELAFERGTDGCES